MSLGQLSVFHPANYSQVKVHPPNSNGLSAHAVLRQKLSHQERLASVSGTFSWTGLWPRRLDVRYVPVWAPAGQHAQVNEARPPGVSHYVPGRTEQEAREVKRMYDVR